MDRTEIARVAHEINRAYCASLGDTSQPSWDEAPEWQKGSALAGVDMHLANPDATPENSHESWLAQKTAEGWKYGPVKDAQKKEHPCFLPYAELPPEQKAKDYLFRAVVHALKNANPLQAAPAPRLLAPTVAAPAADSGLVAVQYVGRKPEWRDALYNTGLYFVADQVRNLPENIARQLLRHGDLFREAKVEVAPVEAEVVAEVVEPNAHPVDDTAQILEAAQEEQQDVDLALQKILDLKQTVGFMDKEALKQFALTNYGLKIDGRLAVEAMREQANQMIDQFGVV